MWKNMSWVPWEKSSLTTSSQTLKILKKCHKLLINLSGCVAVYCVVLWSYTQRLFSVAAKASDLKTGALRGQQEVRPVFHLPGSLLAVSTGYDSQPQVFQMGIRKFENPWAATALWNLRAAKGSLQHGKSDTEVRTQFEPKCLSLAYFVPANWKLLLTVIKRVLNPSLWIYQKVPSYSQLHSN